MYLAFYQCVYLCNEYPSFYYLDYLPQGVYLSICCLAKDLYKWVSVFFWLSTGVFVYVGVSVLPHCRPIVNFGCLLVLSDWLPVCESVCLCMSLCVSVCLSLFLCLYLFWFLSVCLSFYLSSRSASVSVSI